MAEGSKNEFFDRLEEEGEKRGLPSRLLEFYRKLLTIQFRSERLIGNIDAGLKDKTINERLDSGQPLISVNALALDWSLLNDVYIQVIALFTDYPDLFGKLPKRLSQPEVHSSLSERVVKAWFKRASLPSTLAVDDNERLVLEAIIHATIQPFLVSQARSLIHSVQQERWRREYCPVCGGKPDFAFLNKDRGARWLLCSRCDAEWLFQRLQCPYCSNKNQKDLSYFTDDAGVYRLYVCERCHKYIKAIDLRYTEADVLLPLERLLTLDLDNQAREKGYQPGHA